MKQVVILGASYAGTSAAHRILKQGAKTGLTFKITLVSPNTHLYWNIAAPRALIEGQFSDEQLFQPLVDGFTQYPDSRFEFIVGRAGKLDAGSKEVVIVGVNGEKKLKYDFLILATGSHTEGDTPFKGLESTEATKDALHNVQNQVKRAKTIVIAGAGVTGVETAGELAFEYENKKEIILVGFEPRDPLRLPRQLTLLQIASGTAVLEAQQSPESVCKIATAALHKLGVEIRLQNKVTKTMKNADPSTIPCILSINNDFLNHRTRKPGIFQSP